METFYWHDYETWGINPAIDKPSQFAGIRTDFDLNIVGEPLNILCRPALDTLPNLQACLVTGMSPQLAEEKGVSEREFIATIHSELIRPQTCAVGYNSIRFDDEVTRYGFYRNFYDPYAREWQNGNSRWDIIDMMRLCYAVRPGGIEWPQDEQGKVSFRLELLTQANGLVHESAHDALSDVYATIAMAKLVKDKQAKIFSHVLALRSKQAVAKALDLGSGKPILHISSKFGRDVNYGSLILPIAQHPNNKNEIICIDLRYSPEPLFSLDASQLATLLYTRIDELPAGVERIPIKSVHLNRCPIVLTPKLIDDTVAERLSLDLQRCEQHRQALLADSTLSGKLQQVFQESHFQPRICDAEERLYDGFFNQSDKQLMRSIPRQNASSLAANHWVFEDERLPELFFRYRARNFPESLNAQEQQEWLDYCRHKCCDIALSEGDASVSSIDKNLLEIDNWLQERSEEPQNKKEIALSLKDYICDKKTQLLK